MKRSRPLGKEQSAKGGRLMLSKGAYVRLCLSSWFLIFLGFLPDHPLVVMASRSPSRASLVRSLMRGEPLKRLNLNDRGIYDIGVVVVAEYLGGNDSVTHVGLWGNRFGPAGARALADLFTRNWTIRNVNISNNQIGNEGAEALIGALNYNVCITEILVHENGISPEIMSRLKYLTETRNNVCVPAAVRCAALYLIAARRRSSNYEEIGQLAIFPKELVKMIAIRVWETRKDPKWIEAVKPSGP